MNDLLAVFSTAFSLFILLDSIGNIPIFVAIMHTLPPKRRRSIIVRELIISLGVILLFYFLGDPLLALLGVSQDAILIAGGIILFMIAIKMVFPRPHDPIEDKSLDKEPFIVPLAIPLTAGPAVLAAVMLYARQEPRVWVTLSAIVLAWGCSLLVLLSCSLITRLLGPRGIVACERLMGLILTLIAVEMFLKGWNVHALVQ